MADQMLSKAVLERLYGQLVMQLAFAQSQVESLQTELQAQKLALDVLKKPEEAKP